MINQYILKNTIVLALLIAVVFKLSAFAQTHSQVIHKSRLDSIAKEAGELFINDTSRVCLSIGIYDHGEYATYHFANKLAKVPSNQSLYEIGSITKTLTGTLLAKAVTDKEVQLDDDIRKYLDGPYPNLVFQGNPIRLFHLLNHSSGLPFDMPVNAGATGDAYTKGNFLSDLSRVKLDTVPGIKLSYSNAAAQLLGFILEKVYQKPFENLLRDFIFEPLEMANAGITLNSKQNRNLLNGYSDQGKVAPANQSGAAGGVRCSITDMLKYIRFEMDETNPVVELSHRPTWGDIQYYAIGLNWQMDHRNPNPRRIFQSGGTAGFSSNVTFYPDLKVGIILLSNQADRSAQDKLSECVQTIFSIFPK